MLDTLTAARPLFAPELRPGPAEREPEATPPRAAPTEEQPLPEPAEAEPARLSPEPLPVPAPVAEAQERADLKELTAAAGGASEAGPPPDLFGEDGAAADLPSRLDAMSLFQGMLAEATRSGANVPGTSMHIYALVRQLSTMVENKMQVAA